jgi:predicted porin
MNKKLLAVAVTAALAAPAAAFAQSTVTISGNFKVGWENISYANTSPNRLNSTQNRIVDNSSKIIFTTVEALGNGLSAIGNLDVRFAPDQASGPVASNPIGSGNTYVGLRSTTWGQLIVGRHDLHYGRGPSEQTRGAGALVSSDVSLFDFVQTSGGNLPIANVSRTQNVVKYDMPTWNGLGATIAWSANPGNAASGEADMTAGAVPVPAGTNTRKGDAWNINPKYANGPFEAEYSYWKAKPDAPAAATTDQRGDTINAKYSMGGLKVGIGWNRSKLENSTSGIKLAERTTWAVAGSYKWGPHAVYAHYDKAGNISTGVAGTGACPGVSCTDGTGARMISAVYEYAFSKRTSMAATYAKINNDANASYNFFTSGGLGSSDNTVLNGESPRIFQVTINHMF